MACCSKPSSPSDHADNVGGSGSGSHSRGCCSTTALGEPEQCSKPFQATKSNPDPSLLTPCCQPTGPECCDETCIENAAAYECQVACEKDMAQASTNTPDSNLFQEHEHDHDGEGKHMNNACSSHLHLAFERYSSYLETARCICRNILMNSMTPCCARQPSKGDCAPGPSTKTHRNSRATQGITGQLLKRCTSDFPQENQDEENLIAPLQVTTNCCSGSHSIDDIRPPNKNCAVTVAESRDIEKLAAHEHVALSVTGMTCSGCGNKLAKFLQDTPGVFNVRVNFVMGSADFDLNNHATPAEEMLPKIQKATGFHCTRLTSDDQFIDLCMTKEAVGRISEKLPTGVTRVTMNDKQTARITYDPLIVGARSVLDSLGDETTGLAPPSNQDPSATAGKRRLYDMLLKTSLSALCTVPVAVLAWGHTIVDARTKAIVSLVLATLVQALAIPEFYVPALSSLVYNHTIEMDMLVVISITAAYMYSVVAFGFTVSNNPLETKEFFETSTLLITLVLFGRLVAAYARKRAVAAVSTRSLQPAAATIIDGNETREIDVRLLQFGDCFLVKPHTKVPTDGQIIDGISEVDESMLTGESLPVHKRAGVPVIAGTINGSGVLKVRLTRLPGKNTVTDIAGLVEEASNMKPKVQDLADKVAGWFVPVVSAIAVIVFVVWLVICLKVRNSSGGGAVGTAITYAIAVFAVSCPCALGLAVPMVLIVAGGVAARGGVIIKSAESTERAFKVTDVVFDKTGTVTTGELEVVSTEILSTDRSEALSLVKSLVSDNKHPVSVAVSRYLDGEVGDRHVENVRSVPGAGVEGTLGQSSVRAGNARWLQVEDLPRVVDVTQQGMTTLCVTMDADLLAVFGLKANLRPEVISVVQNLQKRGISVHLVSGDEQKAVEEAATAVGIPHENVVSRKSPVEKRAYVDDLMQQGKTVLFCGDGTNDAVAIAQADVGVQIGSSSDLTRAIADVVLLSGLEGLPFLLDVSKASFIRITFNFVWSAVYNVFAILLAAGAFVHVRIPPAYAGLGEIVSVLPVIIVAMSMGVIRRSRKY